MLCPSIILCLSLCHKYFKNILRAVLSPPRPPASCGGFNAVA
nr:MAG TPA: hypothetical protein [Caudoviricetes sp.]